MLIFCVVIFFNEKKSLELLSYTVDDIWKWTRIFKLAIYQDNWNKWPINSDIRHLYDIVTTLISDNIVQRDKN